MLESVKLKVHDILVETDDDEMIDKIVAASLIILIILNVAAVILETVEEYNLAYGHIFRAFEISSVAVFSVEYLLRLWIAPHDDRYAKPFWGRVKYALTPMALIDLVAIIPTSSLSLLRPTYASSVPCAYSASSVC